MNAIEEIDASPAKDNGFICARLNQIKHWFLSHAQYLNFFTILVLASVSSIFLHPIFGCDSLQLAHNCKWYYFGLCYSQLLHTCIIFPGIFLSSTDYVVDWKIFLGAKSFVWSSRSNVWTIWDSFLGVFSSNGDWESTLKNSHTGFYMSWIVFVGFPFKIIGAFVCDVLTGDIWLYFFFCRRLLLFPCATINFLTG